MDRSHERWLGDRAKVSSAPSNVSAPGSDMQLGFRQGTHRFWAVLVLDFPRVSSTLEDDLGPDMGASTDADDKSRSNDEEAPSS